MSNFRGVPMVLLSWTQCLDELPDAAIIFDDQRRVVLANQRAVRLLGYESSSVLAGTDLNTLTASAEGSALNADGQLRGVTFRTASGTSLGLDISVGAIESDGTKLFLAILRVGSVEERTSLAEPSSVEAELRHRTAILEASPDVVCMTDMTGAILYLNRAGREFLGFGPNQDLGSRNMNDVHPAAQTDLLLNVAIPTAIRDGLWTGETAFTRYDSKVITMREMLIGHREPDGRVTCLSCIARDLSRERELEEQFRQAHKMEAVGRLAGGIAHDFNNLLAAIMGSTCLASEMLAEDHPARKELEEVNRASERAASLTGQLLAFCRKQVFQLRILDLNATLLDLEPLIQRLLGKSIQLTMAVGLEPAHIKADPSQLQQVLLNLVVNARDAMPEGGKLRIEARKVMLDDGSLSAQLDLAPGRYVIVLVSDTGHGMTPEISRRIFEPFFTTKGPGHGTGLGLSTVFGIVKQTGGSVRVDTVQGRGTTFEIYLPCTAAPMDEVDVSANEVEPAVGGVILVAEDDEQLRNLIVRSLQRGGYEVLSAESAASAVELATKLERSVDLLLVDVIMPGMSGRELAARLRRDTPALRILYMSGCTEDALVQHELLDSRVGFIPKPFPPGRLLIAVAELLSRPVNALAPAASARSARRNTR